MGPRRARRRGMVIGAAVASSRNNKQQTTTTPQQLPVTPSGTNDDSIEQLKQLAALKDQGILTQEEFDAKKKQILGL